MSFLEFDGNKDFPYYNNNPKLSKTAWIVLLLSIPIGILLYVIFPSIMLGSIVFCLSMLIPLLYFSNWNYSLFIQKPTKNEIILGVLMFGGYLIYSITVGTILDFITPTPEMPNEILGITVEGTVSLIFSMMGEELVKFIPLMFFMRLVYKYSNNRKLAIVVSAIIVLTGFGLMHYAPPYTTLTSVLLIQGAGSMFGVYGYLKTKNIIVPYISHLLTDAFVFITVLSGF